MDRGPHLFATDHYENITAQLKAQALELGPGGLKQAHGSKMYDSLQASQIGTHKLDTGPPNEFTLLSTELQEAQLAFPLDCDLNVAKFFDCLKSAELAWHHGYSLLQTILSNVFVENELSLIKSNFLKCPSANFSLPELTSVENLIQIYVWSVIKCIGQCMSLVDEEASTAVRLEEDLHFVKYDLYWLELMSSQTLVEALEKCRKQAITWKMPLVAERINLQLTWMIIINQRIPRRTVNLDKMLKQLSNFELMEGMEDSRCWFKKGVQARLAMVCLRHPLISFSQRETKDLWLRIITSIRDIIPILSVQRSTDLLGMLLSFSRREEPPIVRAMLKSRIHQTQVLSQSTKFWVVQDICETMPLTSLVESEKLTLDPFIKQLAPIFGDLLISFCENRCRLRETLCSLVISYDSLQFSAEDVDQQLSLNNSINKSTMFISSYVYFRKLQIMLWVVLLSFETKIVAYDEQAYTYWYAYRLCQTLLAHLARMRAVFEQVGGNARSGAGYHFLKALELESQMLQQICLSELLIWLAIYKMSPPKLPPVNLEYRFRLRFKMFQTVGIPETLELASFEEFVSDWEIGLALQGAANSARSARNLLTQLSELAKGNNEITLLQRSAMGLQVFVAKLTKVENAPGKVRVDTSNYHPYFPVPAL